jgi:hypothetical protein
VSGLFLTTYYASTDSASGWMMFWLSSLPQWRQFRDFSVSTSDLNLGQGALTLFEDEDEHLQQRRKRSVRYLPSYNASYKMWYKGRYVTISRTKEESRWYSDKSSLTVTSVFTAYLYRNLFSETYLTAFSPVTALFLTALSLRRGRNGYPQEATRSIFMPARSEFGGHPENHSLMLSVSGTVMIGVTLLHGPSVL